MHHRLPPRPPYIPNEHKNASYMTKVEKMAMHIYSGMVTAADQEGDLMALDCADMAVEEAYRLLFALEKAKK